MKKIFLIIAATIMATTAWAQSQQLLSVKGKTKDGKSINVQYYKGTAQDYIESVKYQLVDELKADNKNKQNTISDLQGQLNRERKKVENLTEQLKSNGNGQNANNEEQLAQKQAEIDRLKQQLLNLNQQLDEKEKENARLQRQVDSLEKVNRILSQNMKHLAKSPVVGIEASMGSVFLSSNKLNNPWEKDLSWNKQVAVYFGTGNLLKKYPVSVEAGVGFRSLPMKASFDHHRVDVNYHDCDGDTYQPVFDGCSEKLTINCLEVPVRVCLGQPDKNKVSMYAKLGVTPSLVLSSNRSNAYSFKGYYADWNVTFEDVDELGFSNVESSEGMTTTSKFNLWGNASLGAYVPLFSSVLFNVGAKLDYPLMKTGTFNSLTAIDKNKPYLPKGLANYDGRMIIPSLQAGLVYTLK